MSLQRVAELADVPRGRGLRVVIDGIEVGLFRVGDAIYAMENACPHAGDPLSEGFVEGCIVTCAAHGWDFDVRTGFRPGDDDGFPIPCFEVQTVDGEIWVDLEKPLNLRRARQRPGA